MSDVGHRRFDVLITFQATGIRAQMDTDATIGAPPRHLFTLTNGAARGRPDAIGEGGYRKELLGRERVCAVNVAR
jgi:hypothetical protein